MDPVRPNPRFGRILSVEVLLSIFSGFDQVVSFLGVARRNGPQILLVFNPRGRQDRHETGVGRCGILCFVSPLGGNRVLQDEATSSKRNHGPRVAQSQNNCHRGSQSRQVNGPRAAGLHPGRRGWTGSAALCSPHPQDFLCVRFDLQLECGSEGHGSDQRRTAGGEEAAVATPLDPFEGPRDRDCWESNDRVWLRQRLRSVVVVVLVVHFVHT
mmetsp:Transcript_19823/g.55241  ORF Transcript_19823/g.55241 Transcript_19823/m.55241 type:complete len:213 (+) Transcript_19823:1608-2246(+)